jgi:hypothetical protein
MKINRIKNITRGFLPYLILGIDVIYTNPVLASRYELETSDAGSSFLLLIPFFLAVAMYAKYEDRGYGKIAATLGGAVGLILIYLFPVQSALLIAVIALVLFVGNIFKW